MANTHKERHDKLGLTHLSGHGRQIDLNIGLNSCSVSTALGEINN